MSLHHLFCSWSLVITWTVMHQKAMYVHSLTQPPNIGTLFPHLQQEALLWLFPFLKTLPIGPHPVLLISFVRSLATPHNLSSQSQRIFGPEQRVFKLVVSRCSLCHSLEARRFIWTMYEHQEDKNSDPPLSWLTCSFCSPNIPCSIRTPQTKLFYSVIYDAALCRRSTTQCYKSCGIRHQSVLVYWCFEVA